MNIEKQKLKSLAQASHVDLPDWNPDFGLTDPQKQFSIQAGPVVVLGLLAEIERLEMDNRSLKGSCSKLGAEHAGLTRLFNKANRMQFDARQERDQLKSENDKLRKALVEIMDQVDGNIREAVRDCVNCRGDVQDIYQYCDTLEGIIDAAMDLRDDVTDQRDNQNPTR